MEIGECYELNNNKDTTHQILPDRAEAVLKMQCRVISAS